MGKNKTLIAITFLLLVLFVSAGIWFKYGRMDNGNDSTSSFQGDPLQPYKLVVVYPSTPQKDEAAIERELNSYLTKTINATIDLRPIDWGPWDDQRNLMIGSEEAVDIYFTAQWTNFAVHVAQGAFLPLDELLISHGQGILAYQNPIYLEGTKINGKNYGISTTKELASQGGILYRKDIAEELGLDMSTVKSVADLLPVLEKVRAAKPEMTPLFLNKDENFAIHYFSNLDSLGNIELDGVVDKEGTDTTVHSKLENPRYISILKATRELFIRSLINSDAATTQASVDDALRSGKVFATTRPLKPGKAEEIAITTNLVGKLGQVEMNARTVSSSETAGAMLAISAASADPERAMMFINLLHTDKTLLNMLNFGIEGIHYTRSGEIISPTDRTPDYSPNISWEFGNQFLNYLWTTENPDKWNQFKMFSIGAKQSPAFGFTFDAEPVKTYAASMINVRRQYDAALETGSVDVDNVLPEYLSRMEAAGLDKVIRAKQEQLNAYLASKNN